MAAPAGFAMFCVFLMLIFFTLQQMYYISKNITQIELDKYEYASSENDKGPISNYYDKGLLKNWIEFIFPPKIAKHEPYKIKNE